MQGPYSRFGNGSMAAVVFSFAISLTGLASADDHGASGSLDGLVFFG